MPSSRNLFVVHLLRLKLPIITILISLLIKSIIGQLLKDVLRKINSGIYSTHSFLHRMIFPMLKLLLEMLDRIIYSSIKLEISKLLIDLLGLEKSLLLKKQSSRIFKLSYLLNKQISCFPEKFIMLIILANQNRFLLD